jgi:hypothetical protein
MFVVLLTTMSIPAAHGTASKNELRQLYQRYFEQKDEQKLATLVFWQGVEQFERDAFFRSIRSDLAYRLERVEFVPLEPGAKLEYTRDGVSFRTALPPIGRMVATYEGHGDVTDFSTSYLVGTRGGRVYINLAVPEKGRR